MRISDNNKTSSTSSLILKTAGKTSLVLVVLLVLVCALFLLLAPMRASDFFYSMGMKKTATSLAYNAASSSNEFDDWWDVLVKGVSANCYDKAYEAADRLEKNEDYSSLISKKTILVGDVRYNAEFYVSYNKAKCGLLAYSSSETDRKGIWNYVQDWLLTNGWGDYVTEGGSTNYNFFSLNPMKGYIDALCTDTSIPLDNFLKEAKDLYNDVGKYANVPVWPTPSKRKDLAYYMKKLCDARTGQIDQDTVAFWTEKAA